jgi:cysteinyl-tRNA synthetase
MRMRLVFATGMLALLSCTPQETPEPIGNGADESPLYVLQLDDVSLDAIGSSTFTLLVIEPSRSGSAADELSAAEVAALRSAGPCGGRKVLAYLSVGEAENYRDYWNPDWVDGAGVPRPGVAPDWLGPDNPDFPGNYKVRYWELGWQAIILGTASGSNATPLDRIINAGYDGVYLDIIDAYEFWSDNEAGAELTRQDARQRMVDWVSGIASYARQTRGRSNFAVFPQNAAGIVFDDDGALDGLGETYLQVVSGIGVEDLFYDETAPQDSAETAAQLEALAQFNSRGKAVMVTDYVLDEAVLSGVSAARAKNFVTRARAAGFAPYAAVQDRDLDEIVTLESLDWGFDQPAGACLSTP